MVVNDVMCLCGYAGGILSSITHIQYLTESWFDVKMILLYVTTMLLLLRHDSITPLRHDNVTPLCHDNITPLHQDDITP